MPKINFKDKWLEALISAIIAFVTALGAVSCTVSTISYYGI